MSLAEKDKIDLITESHGSGPVRLYIIEDREWELTVEGVEQLEAKVTAYYNFIMSGQLNEKMPEAIGKKRIVELHCQHEPPAKAFAIFPQIQTLFAQQNIGFKVIHVCLDYGEVEEIEVYPVSDNKPTGGS
jgi:hypothetical protein